LGSGETIITNSFHGAYWALLMGRKVLIYVPWCSKFVTFPVWLASCGEDDWEVKLSEAISVDGYLEECRAINYEFAGTVIDVLKRLR